MQWLTSIIRQIRSRGIGKPWSPEESLHVDTEQSRRRRELARSENQAGHNLTVQTTIDMARTQTWTGGG